MLRLAEGSVVGTVRDEATDEPLRNVVVALTTLGRTTITDSAGRYAFNGVPAGLHQVQTHFLGYAARSIRVLVPPTGTLELNITLRTVETRLPTLVVRHFAGDRGVHETTTSSADRTVTIAAIRNDPMFIEPDVLLSGAGADVVVRQEAPDGLHIRGGAPDQVAYMLDGIPVFSPYHTAGVFSAWNPDAVSSVTLSSSFPSPSDPSSLWSCGRRCGVRPVTLARRGTRPTRL